MHRNYREILGYRWRSTAYIFQFSLFSGVILASQWVTANTFGLPERQWLFSDGQGQRQHLVDQGYRFNASMMSQAAHNISGGYNHKNSFENAAQLTLGATFDLNKIAAWEHSSAALMVTKRDGNAVTLERINDPRAGGLSNAQEIYGRGKIWRLSQAWIKTGFADNTVQLKVGRMGMSEDFNGSHCEFQNLILCGSQLGKSMGSVWFNSPVGIWGANLKYQFAPDWSIAMGLYEVNPDNIKTQSNSDGFNLNMNNVKGASIPIELAWKTKLSGFKGFNNNAGSVLEGASLNTASSGGTLQGEYKIGALYSTADANDIKTAGKSHAAQYSLWLNAQQQLTAQHSDPQRGLYASFNAVLNDTATSAVHSTQQLAVWYKGPFEQRPHDSIGLGLGNYVVNKRLRESQIDSNLSRGYDRYDAITADYAANYAANYRPIQQDELNVELNYSYQCSEAMMLRPNIQYVYQPAGVKAVDDAWVAGLSMRLNF